MCISVKCSVYITNNMHVCIKKEPKKMFKKYKNVRDKFENSSSIQLDQYSMHLTDKFVHNDLISKHNQDM